MTYSFICTESLLQYRTYIIAGISNDLGFGRNPREVRLAGPADASPQHLLLFFSISRLLNKGASSLYRIAGRSRFCLRSLASR